jgi:hypothetical protein
MTDAENLMQKALRLALLDGLIAALDVVNSPHTTDLDHAGDKIFRIIEILSTPLLENSDEPSSPT